MYMNLVKEAINIFFEFGLFLNAILFVPQAIKIYYRRSAKGLSLITFSGFNVIQILMILHGFFHHDIMLVIGMLLSLITCGAVTIGILFFGK